MVVTRLLNLSRLLSGGLLSEVDVVSPWAHNFDFTDSINSYNDHKVIIRFSQLSRQLCCYNLVTALLMCN